MNRSVLEDKVRERKLLEAFFDVNKAPETTSTVLSFIYFWKKLYSANFINWSPMFPWTGTIVNKILFFSCGHVLR